jgi:hypothetical protein
VSCEVVLHLGAHRTGTTLFQHFLSANFDFFSDLGIDILVPPATRSGLLPDLEPQSGRLLISEENLMGNMQHCVAEASLYPLAAERLSAISNLLAPCRRVMISIRNPADWWPSVIAFSVLRGMDMPSPNHLQTIAQSLRQWSDVLTDIRQMLPLAEIVVREFHWALDRPRQQLRQATRWDEVANALARKRAHNTRPDLSEMADNLAARGQDPATLLAATTGRFDPFDAATRRNLTHWYLQDLALIRRMEGVRLLSDPPAELRAKLLAKTP